MHKGYDIAMNKDELLGALSQRIEEAEQNMARMWGMKIYNNNNGFTQGDLYNICGKTDSVATITFRAGSESEDFFGNDITIIVEYTRAQRNQLLQDSKCLNEEPYVKAKYLLLDLDEEKKNHLLTVGFKVADVISILVFENTQKENYYESKSNRILKKIEIPFEPYGGGEDIGWIYGSYCKFIDNGVTLTVDEMSEYLAYKLILDPDCFSEEEKKQIYNEQGRVSNKDVAWNFLEWKREANKLTETDKQLLSSLSGIRMFERLGKLDNVLKGIGGLITFTKKYPEKSRLIIDKVLKFKEKRYNITGKHLLYLDLDGFLHIYLRHVRELTIEGFFTERTKFQLKEEDVLFVMSQVLTNINEEYQLFKEEHPNRKYKRYNEQAIYFNGDYYRVEVGSNGRIETFFKEDIRNSNNNRIKE